jgi:hypothetical protein
VPIYGATAGMCIKAGAQIGSTGIYTCVLLVNPR